MERAHDTVVLVYGFNGSGKGLVGEEAEKLGIPHLTMSKVLRWFDEEKNMGGALLKMMRGGTPVPDPIVFEALGCAIEMSRPGNDLVIDGMPRNEAQKNWLFLTLKEMGIYHFKTIHMVVAPVEARRRMRKRNRPDDTPEIIESRMRYFRDHTACLVNFLTGFTDYHVVNNSGTTAQDVENVREEIRKILLSPATRRSKKSPGYKANDVPMDSSALPMIVGG